MLACVYMHACILTKFKGSSIDINIHCMDGHCIRMVVYDLIYTAVRRSYLGTYSIYICRSYSYNYDGVHVVRQLCKFCLNNIPEGFFFLAISDFKTSGTCHSLTVYQLIYNTGRIEFFSVCHMALIMFLQILNFMIIHKFKNILIRISADFNKFRLII